MCFHKKEQARREISTMDRLLENFKESTGFYKMVKMQTWISLIIAAIFLIAGLVIYTAGFYAFFKQGKDISEMSIISGSVVELIAGTSFWLHNKSLEELNEFHKRLSSTEKYLTAIMLAERMSEDKRDKEYEWILQNCILTDTEVQTGETMKWRHGDNPDNNKK